MNHKLNLFRYRSLLLKTVYFQALALTRGISSKKAAAECLMVDRAADSMELNLRDAILDMEDRVHVGGLGQLKVSL